MANSKEYTAHLGSIAERLSDFYRSKGLKRPAFAELMGVKYETFSKWEQGKVDIPNWFWTKLLEHYPDADVGFILTGLEGMLKLTRFRRVPLVNEIPAGLINFNFADEAGHETVITENEKDRVLFALRVKGDSMAPEINPGDLVFLSPDRPFVSGKVYAVVTTSSEATLKRVFKRSNGYLLVPENPEYESVLLPDEEVLKLIRVVESKRNYL